MGIIKIYIFQKMILLPINASKNKNIPFTLKCIGTQLSRKTGSIRINDKTLLEYVKQYLNIF